MRKELQLNIILWFTILYLAVFSVHAVLQRNYEFLYYTAIMVVFILVVVGAHRKFDLPIALLAALSMAGALHILGGNIFIGNTRLYDIWIIGHWFRYDNLVHVVSIFAATILAYNLLEVYLHKERIPANWLLGIILVLIGSGLGAMNEIVELVAVVVLGAGEGVGGYLNNAVDLVYNAAGAILASIYIIFVARK